jgi:hypothetical protein
VKSCVNNNLECVLCDGGYCIQCKPNFFINDLDRTLCREKEMERERCML